jgi:hypothetical protein
MWPKHVTEACLAIERGMGGTLGKVQHAEQAAHQSSVPLSQWTRGTLLGTWLDD